MSRRTEALAQDLSRVRGLSGWDRPREGRPVVFTAYSTEGLWGPPQEGILWARATGRIGGYADLWYVWISPEDVRLVGREAGGPGRYEIPPRLQAERLRAAAP